MLNWIRRVLGLPFELPRTPSTSDHVKLVNFVQFGFKHLNRLVVGVCWCVCLLCLPWTPSGLVLDQTQCRAEQNRVEELHGAGFVPSLVALCCCPSVPSPCAPFITSSLSGFFTFILSKLHTNRDCNSEASYWSLYFPFALSAPPLVALCCSLFCLGNWEANSNMGQTHSRHIKCSAGQHRANHNNIPNAQVPMLSSTLFPFPSFPSAAPPSSSTAACNARNLSSTISVCGFCWDSLSWYAPQMLLLHLELPPSSSLCPYIKLY